MVTGPEDTWGSIESQSLLRWMILPLDSRGAGRNRGQLGTELTIAVEEEDLEGEQSQQVFFQLVIGTTDIVIAEEFAKTGLIAGQMEGCRCSGV